MNMWLGGGCLFAYAVSSQLAWAQETPAAEQPAAAGEASAQQDASSGLSEIVVSATRRSTNLQTTPVAVSAVDRNIIAQASPHDIGDLASFVPNFSAAKSGVGFNTASFAMRGVGQTNPVIYFEPPVAVLVDDFVYSSVQTQLLDTFDIDQVEVLRGPQGTLFGKTRPAAR
jgi:iron complex outermembrane receptor protein